MGNPGLTGTRPMTITSRSRSRLRLYDAEDLLAECPHQLAGIDRADAPAPIKVAWLTTVIRSRCPRALMACPRLVVQRH